MLYSALAFLAGVCAVQGMSTLPPANPYLLVCLLPGVWSPRRWLRGACAFLVGLLYCAWRAGQLLAVELPADLERRDLLVQGVVRGLPELTGSGRLRFRLQIERWRGEAGWQPLVLPARVYWYRQPADLRPGERWQLLLRLKRPRGLSNFAGFDYERWLFAHGIRATGYVRGSPDNHRVSAAHDTPVAHTRRRLSQFISQTLADSPRAGLVAALGVGDRSGMSGAHWEVLRATGTSHLMAISGLHVGLVAALVFAVARRCWGRSGLSLLRPAPSAAAVCAIVAATAYALLAGFQVPAQRALVMVWLWMLSVCWRARPDPWRVWAAALWLVLLLDPLGVLTAGFWLSFGAVAWIIYLTRGRVGQRSRAGATFGTQTALVVGLTPLLWVWFHEVSLLAPLANLVAIPWVGLLVVPVLLGSLLLVPFWPPLAAALLRLADWLLATLWWCLEWLAAVPSSLLPLSEVTVPVLLLLVSGLVMAVAPRPLPLGMLAVVLVSPSLLAVPERPAAGDVWLTLLDVGQGLAAVVETSRHVLVFDAGPAFAGGIDSGQTVVAPYLLQRGHRRVDRVVISHSDNDHLGGGAAVFRRLDVQSVHSGEPAAIAWARSQHCNAGQAWDWDGVAFEYLTSGFVARGNNASCVLRIEAADGRAILLPGDIERSVELELVANRRDRLRAEVLVAPHHGSRTSSSEAFVRAVAPGFVVFAVGHQNRFGFPKHDVVARYLGIGAAVLDTADDGAILLRVENGRDLQPSCHRALKPRYWN